MEFMGALDTLTNSDSGGAKLNFVDHGKLAFLKAILDGKQRRVLARIGDNVKLI
jgi:hypothetical protein